MPAPEGLPVSGAPPDVIQDVADGLAAFTGQDKAPTGSAQQALRTVIDGMARIRRTDPQQWASMAKEPLGFWQDRVGGEITLQPTWASSRAWMWLLQHRRNQLDKANKDITPP